MIIDIIKHTFGAVFRLLFVALILISLQTPARAGEITHWCGLDVQNTCSDWVPVHFAHRTIHYTIDPSVPMKKFLKLQLSNFDAHIENIDLVFDGFIENEDPNYLGVRIVYSALHDSFSGDLGVTHISSVTELEDHAEIINATVRMNKKAYTKFKTLAKNQHVLSITVVHEFMHALGIAHNNDSTSIMYPFYTSSKSLLDSDIATLNDLYTDVPARTVNLN